MGADLVLRMFTGYPLELGKSMLASKYIVDNYKRYKDSERPVQVISNIPLSIPYQRLEKYFTNNRHRREHYYFYR